jgi:hypothetical protein
VRIAKNFGFGNLQAICDKENFGQGTAFNIRGAARLIDEKTPEVWAILEEIIKDKLVLFKPRPDFAPFGYSGIQANFDRGRNYQIAPIGLRII